MADKNKNLKIIPAIDIKEGKCVRLYKGSFDEVRVYADDPWVQAKIFESLGFKYLHIVDLDGAVKGQPVNSEIIKKIIKETNLKVEVSGGIRTLRDAEDYLSLGVWQIVFGTVAFQSPEILKSILNEYGNDRISVAVDFNGNKVMIKGWLESSEIQLDEVIEKLSSLGVSRFIFTDISKDGTLEGPELETLNELRKINAELIYSGGIGNIRDVRNIYNLGFEGVVIGKAFYENLISIKELNLFM